MTSSGQIYQATAGETFDSVALAVYGNEKYAAELLCANPEMCLRPVFSGGEYLDLPIVEKPDDEEGEAYAIAEAPWKG